MDRCWGLWHLLQGHRHGIYQGECWGDKDLIQDQSPLFYFPKGAFIGKANPDSEGNKSH